MPDAPTTTLTLFRYGGSRHKLWALAQMQLAQADVARIPGAGFARLLGSGQRFHYLPDLAVYGLLVTWPDPDDAERFFDGELFARFEAHAEEVYTLTLQSFRAHGSWSGEAPFPADAPVPESGPIAVLTRASLTASCLKPFWDHALEINRSFASAEDCWLSLGIGEWPLMEQATFSLWRDAEAMRAFAYAHPAHLEAMRRSKVEGWFSEECFARFVPVASRGTWGGVDPLTERGLPVAAK